MTIPLALDTVSVVTMTFALGMVVGVVVRSVIADWQERYWDDVWRKARQLARSKQK
jgi:hypothetical protein